MVILVSVAPNEHKYQVALYFADRGGEKGHESIQ